jgi:hypothetical protein
MQNRGELRPDASIQALADITMAAIQGGLLLTQGRRDPQQLRNALGGARSVLATAAALLVCGARPVGGGRDRVGLTRALLGDRQVALPRAGRVVHGIGQSRAPPMSGSALRGLSDAGLLEQ